MVAGAVGEEALTVPILMAPASGDDAVWDTEVAAAESSTLVDGASCAGGTATELLGC